MWIGIVLQLLVNILSSLFGIYIVFHILNRGREKMKKKVLSLLLLTSFISLDQVIPDTKVYAEETKVVGLDKAAVEKEFQSILQGKDPDNEIELKPGESAPLPDWVKEIEQKNNRNLSPRVSNGTISLPNQFISMSENSYLNKGIGSWSSGEWQLYKKYTNPDTSFTAYVYRKNFIWM